MPADSLRALLSGAIDYAGLFPPASLALTPALQNHAVYVRSDERWMLGAFILPIGQFDAAGAQLEQFDARHPLNISALGPRTESASAFHGAVSDAAAVLREFAARETDRASVQQFEMPVPNEVESLGETHCAFDDLALEIFWEAPADAAAERIAQLAGSGAGFKLRTGGVTADAFPTSGQIARALVAAARHKVPIKFTAGLHHPVRLFHESVGTKMHGFLNVLGAGVLAAEHGWSEAETVEMLEDEDPGSFFFDDGRFRWRAAEISTEQLIAWRRLVTSLGSCSFDEPRDDLRALRVL